MTDKRSQELLKLAKKIESLDYIEVSDIPNINLYMDQLTTFMDETLASSKRRPEDKILTKTMINNYAKNHLLPPPDKKKYSKDHVILLIFIYYMKNVISISDINTLLAPLKEEYFGGKGEITMTEIYNEMLSFFKKEESYQYDLVKEQLAHSEKLFTDTDLSEEKVDTLRRLSFICALSFDVYLKKLMIETMIDEELESLKSESKDSKKGRK